MRDQDSESPSERLWQRYNRADKQHVAASMALFRARTALIQSIHPSVKHLERLRSALRDPLERGPALRLLLDLDEALRREVFPTLVELASIGHSDIELVRKVILSLNVDWVLDHIQVEVERILEQSAVRPNNYEEFRRLAELLDMIHSPYLAMLVAKAAVSDDLDIREVAEDFGSKL